MRRARSFYLALALLASLAGFSGCSILVPQVSSMPVAHNPFPQLSRVAVLPFFNQSDESYVDGREFAIAYFGELQEVPGFEVVPLGAVEETMIDLGIDLNDAATAPDEIRRLGRALGVDAVVVGSVTDFRPYYPPRCGLHVQWYATNSGLHEIPAGYGLPWGTPDEEYIPDRVAFDAELALAKAQMATQTPVCGDVDLQHPMSVLQPTPLRDWSLEDGVMPPLPKGPGNRDVDDGDPFESGPADMQPNAPNVEAEALPPPPEDATEDLTDTEGDVTPAAALVATTDQDFAFAGLPADWPDARGFVPPGPMPARPACVHNPGPVMTHTRIFRGHDPEFTSALAAYVDFRDDARFGGWRSYLERSDDFIRFCCHLHITQMLEARGGVSETRVVQRWADDR